MTTCETARPDGACRAAGTELVISGQDRRLLCRGHAAEEAREHEGTWVGVIRR